MRDVFFLTCGTMHVPGPALRPPGRAMFGGVTLTNTVGVVVRDGGDLVLVDCGWSAEACSDPRVVGRVRARYLGLKVKPGDAIVDQLAALGFEASRVKTIAATHLHLDHVGAVCDSPTPRW